MERRKGISPMLWVGALSMANALPFVVITIIAEVMYKRMGLSNVEIAFYTSWVYLPWVLKPLWKPLADRWRANRWCVPLVQLLVAVGLAGAAFALKNGMFARWSLAYLWLIAFCCATHDTLSLDTYCARLDDFAQTLFVGLRRNTYRVTNIVCQGFTLLMAGMFETYYGGVFRAWFIVLLTLAAVMLFFSLFHAMVSLSGFKETESEALEEGGGYTASFLKTIRKQSVSVRKHLRDIIHHKNMCMLLWFLLFLRLPESLLHKINQLFMLDSIQRGGLGLTTLQVGFANGTVGVIGLAVGGVVGGALVMRHGLKRWWWPMLLGLTLPNVVYWLMSMEQTMNFALVNALVFVEQLGNGFGNVAFVLYMLSVLRKERALAYLPICTAAIALGVMLPGMAAGWLEDAMGYYHFFIFVAGSGLITLLLGMLVKADDVSSLNFRGKMLLTGDLSPLLSWCLFRKNLTNKNNSLYEKV